MPGLFIVRLNVTLVSALCICEGCLGSMYFAVSGSALFPSYSVGFLRGLLEWFFKDADGFPSIFATWYRLLGALEGTLTVPL